MKSNLNAIDCDVHINLPGTHVLLPWLDDYWRQTVTDREVASLESISYPPNAPISARNDWKNADGRAAMDLGALQRDVLDRWKTDIAIINCIYGVHLVFNIDMARVLARALNSWIAREWLDRDPRLRASIVLPLQHVEFAVEEIEFWAHDKRFVQVLVPVMGEAPLGNRRYWPVWAACEKHGLPIGVHAGSAHRHPPTSIGWTSWYVEDYSAQSLGFQSQLASLVTEGVFQQFPKLKAVFIESGVTWLPAHMWRLSKFWRGVRNEVPWLDRSPSEIIRDHIRLTAQPFDAPEGLVTIEKICEHLQSDAMLLYASDYPHWQFDGDAVLPEGVSQAMRRKLMVDNPLATYPRLAE